MKTQERTREKDMRMLVADDDRGYLQTIGKDFEPYDVEYVHNVGDLVARARNAHEADMPYDFILTDNKMPEDPEKRAKDDETGIYAIMEIRRFDKSTPIFLNSTYLTEDDKNEALYRGANKCYDKPVRVEELLEDLIAIRG